MFLIRDACGNSEYREFFRKCVHLLPSSLNFDQLSSVLVGGLFPVFYNTTKNTLHPPCITCQAGIGLNKFVLTVTTNAFITLISV